MIRFKVYLLIFVFVFSSFHVFAQSSSDNQVNFTFFVDSLENVLKTAPEEEKVVLLDTLIKITKNKYPDLSLLYMEQFVKIPDNITGFEKKAAIYKEMSRLYEKANKHYQSQYYFKLYTNYLEKIPEKKNDEFYLKASKVVKQSNYSFFNKNTLIILITILIILLIVYLSFITTRIKDSNSKIEVLDNELDILRNKNNELKEELDRLAVNVSEQENEEVKIIRKKILTLKKELNNFEGQLFKRNNFLSNISPEIKTLLNSMIGFSEELVTELKVRDSKKLLNYAVQIHQKVLKLSIIFQNMVDVATIRINAYSVKTGTVDLAQIIENIINKKLIFKAIDKVTVSISDKSSKVISEANTLSYIILGILLNLLQEDKTSGIKIRTENDTDNKKLSLLIITNINGINLNDLQDALLQDDVIKTGKGINFTDFYFNIYTAKNILKFMNGELKIEENNDSEIVFKITLPAFIEKGTLKAEQEIKKTKPGKPEKTLDIFLVEDDRMNRLVIETMLKNTGKVTSAVDGEETLKIFKQYKKEGKQFDVLLFDINLPAPWDGIMLMKKIRKDYPEYRNVPCIAQTAYALASDREKFMNEGFDDYLTKPINKNELITIIYQQVELFKSKTRI